MEQNRNKSLCLVCHEVTDIENICGFSTGNVCKSCVAEIIEQFIGQIQEIPDEEGIEYYESDDSE